MKLGRHLLAQMEECTGCRLCVFACSMLVAGCFSTGASIIRVLGNDEFARFYPAIITAPCACGDGEELCVRACPHDVLRFLDDVDAPAYLRQVNSPFVAAPILDAVAPPSVPSDTQGSLE